MADIPKYMLSEAQKRAIADNPWLTDRERRVFELYYRRGWPIEDVAAELDEISRSTVKRILKSIRDKHDIKEP